MSHETPTYQDSGGAVNHEFGLYVERDVDGKFFTDLIEKREIFVLTAPRQIGKSSLWTKAVGLLRKEGVKIGSIDLRGVHGYPEESNTNPEGWTQQLLRGLTRAFGLDWNDYLNWRTTGEAGSSAAVIAEYFSEFLRNRLDGTIIVTIDEIDHVQLFYSFTDSLFEAIRSLAPRRRELDISFVLIGISPPSLLLTSNGSSFNTFKKITLSDFDPSKRRVVHDWASAYPVKDEKVRNAISKAILLSTGGHPFLTSAVFVEALDAGIETAADVEILITQLTERAKEKTWLSDHFKAPREIILHRSNLVSDVLDLYSEILTQPIDLTGRRLPDDVLAALMASGLIKFDPANEKRLMTRSPIYQTVFDSEWVNLVKKEHRLGGFGENYSGAALISGIERKKICIINTGGMISTELQGDGKIVVPLDLTKFYQRFTELNLVAEVTAIPLMSKDSSDMNPDDWVEIAETIYENRYEGYDGFVVAHGTDTLPHTASAVAFALGDALDFPVVFVGSQVGSHVLHGDARVNLMRAAAVATHEITSISRHDQVTKIVNKIPEVVAVVDDYIHRGVRVEKKDDFRFDGLHSPTWRPLGRIADDIDISPSDLRQVDRKRDMSLQNKFSHGVFKVSLYPGMDPRFLIPLLNNPALDGIIIETLGIGNVPIKGKWGLISFIEQATAKNIPVLLVSQFPIQPRMTDSYGPALPPLQAGAIPALNFAPPAAAAKFMWVLPQVDQKIANGLPKERRISEVKKMMFTDYVGELE